MGDAAGMSRSEALTYLYLTASHRTWSATVTLDEIMAGVGLSRRGVQLALRALEARGMIQCAPRKGRGYPTTYLISAGDDGAQNSAPREEKAQVRAQNSATLSAEQRNLNFSDHLKEQQQQQQQEHCTTTAAVDQTEGNGARSETLILLEAAGIGPPTLSNLADRCVAGEVPPATLRLMLENAQEQGVGTGLIVSKVRDLIRQREARQTLRSQRQRKRQQPGTSETLETAREQRDEVREGQAGRDAELAALSPAEFADLAETVKSESVFLAKLDPTKSSALRFAMFRRLVTR